MQLQCSPLVCFSYILKITTMKIVLVLFIVASALLVDVIRITDEDIASTLPAC